MIYLGQRCIPIDQPTRAISVFNCTLRIDLDGIWLEKCFCATWSRCRNIRHRRIVGSDVIIYREVTRKSRTRLVNHSDNESFRSVISGRHGNFLFRQFSLFKSASNVIDSIYWTVFIPKQLKESRTTLRNTVCNSRSMLRNEVRDNIYKIILTFNRL